MNWTRLSACAITNGTYNIDRCVLDGRDRYSVTKGRMKQGTFVQMKSFDTPKEAKAFMEGLGD